MGQSRAHAQAMAISYGESESVFWGEVGKSVLKQKALIFQKGDLYFKAGIYREGSAKRKLSTERVYMKDPTYAILK